MTVPDRKDGEGELEYLRRKEAAFGIWQADALERIRDLESEVTILEADKMQRVAALNQVRWLLVETCDYILHENFDLPIDTFARDFAPFKNLMAHKGFEPYAKSKKGKKK